MINYYSEYFQSVNSLIALLFNTHSLFIGTLFLSGDVLQRVTVGLAIPNLYAFVVLECFLKSKQGVACQEVAL